MALTIIAGVAFGGETGFLVGAITMLTSNMLFSQGPWMSWQMFTVGIIGFLAGPLFRKGACCCGAGEASKGVTISLLHLHKYILCCKMNWTV